MKYFLVISLLMTSGLIHTLKGQDEDLKRLAATLTASYREMNQSNADWWSFTQLDVSFFGQSSIALKMTKLEGGLTVIKNQLIELKKESNKLKLNYYIFKTGKENMTNTLRLQDIVYANCKQEFKKTLWAYRLNSSTGCDGSHTNTWVTDVSCEYLNLKEQSGVKYYQLNYGNSFLPRWKPCAEYCPEDHNVTQLAAVLNAQFQGITDDIIWDFRQMQYPSFFYQGCPSPSLTMSKIVRGNYTTEYPILVDKVNDQLRIRIYSFSNEWAERHPRTSSSHLQNLTPGDIIFLNCTITFTNGEYETFIANTNGCEDSLSKQFVSVNCQLLTIYQKPLGAFFAFERLHNNALLHRNIAIQCCPYFNPDPPNVSFFKFAIG